MRKKKRYTIETHTRLKIMIPLVICNNGIDKVGLLKVNYVIAHFFFSFVIDRSEIPSP